MLAKSSFIHECVTHITLSFTTIIVFVGDLYNGILLVSVCQTIRNGCRAIM